MKEQIQQDVISLKIKTETKSSEVICLKGENLREVLVRQGYRIPSPCGGKGRCGKCKVKLIKGQAVITLEDEASFSMEELLEGWRLACRLFPKQNMEIFVPQEQEYQIVEQGVNVAELEGFLESSKDRAEKNIEEAKRVQESYVVAIDIGTTTIVFQLLERHRKKIVHTVSMLNSQRVFGADVISRIQAATTGKKEQLTNSIRADLASGMKKLLREGNRTIQEVEHIVVGANTTMVHLLMGYDCSTLGEFPFQAVTLSMLKVSWKELMGEEVSYDAETIIFPGISAFVGGDIVAGLYACGFDCTEEIALLLDLGTNGELALGNKECLLVTSTAAGPAFEGGNLSCGTGSVAGAICSVKLSEGETEIKTLWNQPPVGLCGTGVVELMAELVRQGFVDETGLLAEEYFENGFLTAKTKEGKKLYFTQGDIRELQLAKAAVYAGIEVLLQRYGICKEQVAKVYIAGGFGYGLNKDAAIAIGMLPEEFRDKITVVGNSCITGLERFLTEKTGEERINRLVSVAEEIHLAMDTRFQDCYLDAMMFTGSRMDKEECKKSQ